MERLALAPQVPLRTVCLLNQRTRDPQTYCEKPKKLGKIALGDSGVCAGPRREGQGISRIRHRSELERWRRSVGRIPCSAALRWGFTRNTQLASVWLRPDPPLSAPPPGACSPHSFLQPPPVSGREVLPSPAPLRREESYFFAV